MAISQVPIVESSEYASAGEWFLRSGIQEANGGVARYYLSDSNQNAPISSEITGYFASALIDLHHRTSHAPYLEAATKAAQFLVDEAWDPNCGAMQFECGPDPVRYSYFFDDGIIVRGLLAVWRKLGDPELLAIAAKCGDSMARDFFDGDAFAPIIELPGKNALSYGPTRWSRSPGCYQLKSALAWYELWQATGQEAYRDLYEKMLTASLADHRSFLPGSDTDIPVMDRLHAYCYFLEGLLPSIERPQCRHALAFGIKFATAWMKAVAPKFLRSDVVAQLLRVRLFADALDVCPLDAEVAYHDVERLRSFQSKDLDVRLKGGHWFGRKGDNVLPFMNPVSTAFCHQTLQMWEEYQAGDRQLEWQRLV